MMRFAALCTVLAQVTALHTSPSARLEPHHTQPVTRFTTDTGVRVLVQPDTNSDTAAICVLVRAGCAEERGSPGLGDLVAHALLGANRNQTAEEVNHVISDIGGSIETEWNPDYTLVTCVTSRSELSDALNLLCNALKTAKFAPDDLNAAARETDFDANKERTDAFRTAYAAVRRAMYQDSPYAGPFTADKSTLRRYTQATARAFHRRWYTPKNTVISVCGNVDAGTIQMDLANYLVDYDRPGAPGAAATAQPAVGHADVVLTLPGHTVTILSAFAAPGIVSSDYPAFKVFTAIVGGGKASRLWAHIRDAGGLGYAVGAYAAPLALDSQLLAYVEYSADRTTTSGAELSPLEVGKALHDSVTSVITDPPSAPELERGRNFAIGRDALVHERLRDRAFYTGWYELIGVGAQFDRDLPNLMASVTSADISRVAARYLNRSCIAVVGPRAVVAHSSTAPPSQ